MTFIYQDESNESVLNIAENGDIVIKSQIPENHVIIGIEGRIRIPSDGNWRRIT